MYNSQGHFFDVVIQKDVFPQDGTNGLKVYQELIYHRFYEVISNCYPFSLDYFKDEVEELIVEFIHHEPKTPFIWQVPNEFRAFLKGRFQNKFPFLDNLLWYEWIEVELFMGEYVPLHVKEFSWDKTYVLNENTRIKKLDYKVYDGEMSQKGEFWVLAYYDVVEEKVLFRELNEVLYMYLLLQEEIGSKDSLKEIARLAETDENDVKEALNEALKTLCHIGVLKDKK